MISNDARAAVAAVAAVLALVVWGCAADRTPPLRLATSDTRTDRAIEAARIEVFSAEHPDLAIERIERSGGPESVMDLLRVDAHSFAAERARVSLLDLAPYLARVGIDLTSYDSSLVDAFRRGRAVYALPRGYSPLVLLFNRALFDSAGIAYPSADWTWDDFLAAAATLTRDTNGDGTLDQWGTYFDQHAAIWLAWIESGGGDVLCPRDPPRASGCLDSHPTITAVRWYAAWPNEQRIARPWIAGSEREALQMFAAGQVAMITVDHSVVPVLRSLAAQTGLRYGFSELPHREGVASRTILRVSAYAVPVASRRRKLAVGLAAALVDSAAQDANANAGYELPAAPRAAAGLMTLDSVECSEEVFLTAASHARLPWGVSVQKWPVIDVLLERLMVRLAAGGVGDEPFRETAREMDRVLSER